MVDLIFGQAGLLKPEKYPDRLVPDKSQGFIFARRGGRAAAGGDGRQQPLAGTAIPFCRRDPDIESREEQGWNSCWAELRDQIGQVWRRQTRVVRHQMARPGFA